MARTLSEIYAEAKRYRDQYLGYTPATYNNPSKMSVFDAFTWTVSACIWAFENIMDVFTVDMSEVLSKRVNGTKAYYAHMLLRYQRGDTLQVSDDGAHFSYPSIDTTKQIVKHVSVIEAEHPDFYDKSVIIKVAGKGIGDTYAPISQDDLRGVRSYVDQIAFAGTDMTVVSRKGDILIPVLTVYYDGYVTKSEIQANVNNALTEYINALDFDESVYVQKVIDAIQRAEHVTDVYVAISTYPEQGIFYVSYDDDDNPIQDVNGATVQKIERYFTPNSGYMRQSTGTGDEQTYKTWSQSITYIVGK